MTREIRVALDPRRAHRAPAHQPRHVSPIQCPSQPPGPRSAHRMPGWLREPASIHWFMLSLSFLGTPFWLCTTPRHRPASLFTRCTDWNPHLQQNQKMHVFASVCVRENFAWVALSLSPHSRSLLKVGTNMFWTLRFCSPLLLSWDSGVSLFSARQDRQDRAYPCIR